MIRVIVESPYRGDVDGNLTYLRRCMRDCVLRGESPYASHGLLTQPGVLDDNNPAERELGIELGFAWRDVSNMSVFYVDKGWSAGMWQALVQCGKAGARFEIRRLDP